MSHFPVTHAHPGLLQECQGPERPRGSWVHAEHRPRLATAIPTGGLGAVDGLAPASLIPAQQTEAWWLLTH